MKIVSRLALVIAVAGSVLVLGHLLLRFGAVEPVTAKAPSQVSPAGYVVDTDQVANPPVLLAGEALEIQLSVRAACPSNAPLHIVFVLDASGSMSGTRSMAMKKAVKAFVRDLDMATNPATKVGVVQYSFSARTLCQLTNDTSRAELCVDKVGSSGGGSVDRGITEGLNVLRKGRNGPLEPVAREAMVVVSDGPNNNGCQPVRQASGRAKFQGVLVVSVGIGDAVDRTCMLEISSGTRFSFEVHTFRQWRLVVDGIRAVVRNDWLRALEVNDTLPESLEYVAGSSVPPAEVSVDQKTLHWRTDFAPAGGVTYTFKVRPLEAGAQQTHVTATLLYRQVGSNVEQAEFPRRLVTVFR